MKPSTVMAMEQAASALSAVLSDIRADTREVNASNDITEVIRNFDQVRRAGERIKEMREALYSIEEELSRDTVPLIMRNNSVKTVTIEGVGRVTISARFSASILDKKKAYNWLRENGHGGIIQETVNSSTLSAFAKNMIEEEGKELPDDLFKTGSMTYTSITKVK